METKITLEVPRPSYRCTLEIGRLMEGWIGVSIQCIIVMMIISST